MALHFSVDEFEGRLAATLEELAQRGLDGLLIFRQESMFYLTGYDTFGYCFFQCLFLGADGRLTLLTRAPDLRQAQHTSTLQDIRIWVDCDGSNPANDLRAILQQHGCRGQRLGIEFDATGLNAFHWRRLEAALDGFCTLEDSSDLVSRLRLVKSPAEIDYIRQAATLADAALEQASVTAKAGAFEGDILAAMQGAVFSGGGDYPGNEFIIGSGHDALLCRYFTGRRELSPNDQLTLEFAGAYRRYHVCLMRTIMLGEVHPAHRDMHNACAEALDACMQAVKPGNTIGQVFDAHAGALDNAGYRDARLNACGYSLGAVYTPCWMDWPMLYHGNPVVIESNMVFFLHMILMDSANDRAMTLGQTVLVNESGFEALSNASLELMVR